ncbi:hypothetical protein EGW08_014638 [Elysia chlorotica]|uniref:Uncharacterized protein n=1 Tax=Elysia chlorotica TaxID=188477 RepID=A0A3S1BCQ8_ELYCH|nr:hypothetical protein EGW08_014638 [Elysia chlorotica]
MDADIQQELIKSPTAYVLRHPFIYNKFGGWADFYIYRILSDAGSGKSCALTLAPVNTSTMRRSRCWYIFPLVINVALIYSSKDLLRTLETPTGEDVEFPVCEWLLYTAVAISSPMFLVMSRLLPHPSLGLCLGGLFTSSGLLLAGLTTPGSLNQKLAYGLGNGLGISLSMQAITLALSPYFVKESVQAASSTLLLSLITMLTTHHITSHLQYAIGSYSLMILLGILVLVTSCLPQAAYLVCACADCWGRRRIWPTVEEGLLGDVSITSDHETKDRCPVNIDEMALLTDSQETQLEPGESTLPAKKLKGCLNTMGRGLAVIMEDTGWKASFLSVLVWLTWGTGVDTTWLDIGSTQEVLPYPHRLPSLHLVMGFTLLAVKLASQQWLLPCAGLRLNLASNYMYLGLLGCSGVLLCLFPENSNPLHGSLLFTASLALQYDDLSDLYLLPGKLASQGKSDTLKTGAFTSLVSSLSPFSRLQSSYLSSSEIKATEGKATPPLLSRKPTRESVLTYTVVQCDVMSEAHSSKPHLASPCLTSLCLVGHSLSLFFMATLSMVLGLQIANLLRQLFTVPPFSFLSSSGGLLVLSSAAIAMSLGKPDVWIGEKRGYTVIS